MYVTMTALSPGRMPRSPPYLFIAEQDAAFTERPPPSVLRQVMVPELSLSCITTVPAPALFMASTIEAVNPPRVGVMPRASTSDDTPPLRMRDNERCFNNLAMVTMAPWRGPVDLPNCGRLGSRQGRIGSHRIPPGSFWRPCSATTQRNRRFRAVAP